MADRLLWQEATVVAIVAQTPTVKSYFLKPMMPFDFVAGQHVDIRLTAPDGYQAQRSYSIASAPGGATIELTVERLDEGEVSPFFHEVVAIGDAIELRGPIGGHFNWSPATGGPVLLVGGGSGVVPLVSMVRHRASAAPSVPFALVYSARRREEVLFRDELGRQATLPGLSLFLTLTREPEPLPEARAGRIGRALIAEAIGRLRDLPRIAYVCGSNAFVEVATMILVEEGLPFAGIRTERFGGSPAPAPWRSATMPDV